MTASQFLDRSRGRHPAMTRDLQGWMLILGVVSLLACAGVVVVAVSSQSGGARSAFASVLAGRRLTMLAESAVAEAQAELARALEGRGAGGAAVWRVAPRRTRLLAAKEYAGTSVTDVRVTRLSYDAEANRGEVELVATASSASLLGRKLVRSVTRRHFFSLSPDRATFEVAEVAHRCRVDCEAE